MIIKKKGKSFNSFKSDSDGDGDGDSDFIGSVSRSDEYNGEYNGEMVGGLFKKIPPTKIVSAPDTTKKVLKKSSKQSFSKQVRHGTKQAIYSPFKAAAYGVGTAAIGAIGVGRTVGRAGIVAGNYLSQRAQHRFLGAKRHATNEALGLRRKRSYSFGSRTKTNEYDAYKEAAKQQKLIVQERDRQLKKINASTTYSDAIKDEKRARLMEDPTIIKKRWLRRNKSLNILGAREKLETAQTELARKIGATLAVNVSNKTNASKTRLAAIKSALNITSGSKSASRKKQIREGLKTFVDTQKQILDTQITQKRAEITKAQEAAKKERLDNPTGTVTVAAKELAKLRQDSNTLMEDATKFNTFTKRNLKQKKAKAEYNRRVKITQNSAKKFSNIVSNMRKARQGIVTALWSPKLTTGQAIKSFATSIAQALPKELREIKAVFFNPSTVSILDENHKSTLQINATNVKINSQIADYDTKYKLLQSAVTNTNTYTGKELKNAFNSYNDLSTKQKALYDARKAIGELKLNRTLNASQQINLQNKEKELLQLENDVTDAKNVYLKNMETLPNDDNKSTLIGLYKDGQNIIDLTLQNEKHYSDLNKTNMQLEQKNRRDRELIANLDTSPEGIRKILNDAEYNTATVQTLLNPNTTISDSNIPTLNKEIENLKKIMRNTNSTRERAIKEDLLNILEAKAKIYLHDTLIKGKSPSVIALTNYAALPANVNTTFNNSKLRDSSNSAFEKFQENPDSSVALAPGVPPGGPSRGPPRGTPPVVTPALSSASSPPAAALSSESSPPAAQPAAATPKTTPTTGQGPTTAAAASAAAAVAGQGPTTAASSPPAPAPKPAAAQARQLTQQEINRQKLIIKTQTRVAQTNIPNRQDLAKKRKTLQEEMSNAERRILAPISSVSSNKSRTENVELTNLSRVRETIFPIQTLLPSVEEVRTVPASELTLAQSLVRPESEPVLEQAATPAPKKTGIINTVINTVRRLTKNRKRPQISENTFKPPPNYGLGPGTAELTDPSTDKPVPLNKSLIVSPTLAHSSEINQQRGLKLTMKQQKNLKKQEKKRLANQTRNLLLSGNQSNLPKPSLFGKDTYFYEAQAESNAARALNSKTTQAKEQRKAQNILNRNIITTHNSKSGGSLSKKHLFHLNIHHKKRKTTNNSEHSKNRKNTKRTNKHKKTTRHSKKKHSRKL